MWIIISILFIICMCLFPYAARAIARRRILTRLCRDIRRAGGKIRRLRRFPALTRNCSKRPELLVRVEETQYIIKLWSPMHHDAELWVESDGRVVETRKVGAPLTPHNTRRPRTIRGFRYAVPQTKVRTRTSRGLQQESILLVAPSYRRILRREGNVVREIAAGEILFEKILCTPESFLERMTNK